MKSSTFENVVLTMEGINRIQSPALRNVLVEQFLIRSKEKYTKGNSVNRINAKYPKYSVYNRSNCICVLGGM